MQKRLNLKILGLLLASLVVLFGFLLWVRLSEKHELGQPYETLPVLKTELRNSSVNLSEKPVIDLSAFQPYKSINYSKLANNISGAVVRVQDGLSAKSSVYINSDGSDPAFKYHITGLQAEGIPVAVYAYANGSSVAEMQKEAKTFYDRAKAYQPTFWWLDIESVSMTNLNAGVEAFRAELKTLGAKNIGIYSRDNFLTENAISTSKFDAVWLAFYGATNDGSYTALTSKRTFQMQQYTDQGKLSGYASSVDMSRVLSDTDYKKLFLTNK
ncbi:MAG: glycosyl hydrolase family 25 [Streptococcaceae bacterium]|nr:glycosyl hydrolase family 25 [Streptococcaceae bacterium]